MSKRDEVIVGLDIGTTKVSAVVGEITPTGLDITAIGTVPAEGLKKGAIVDVENTIKAIERAVEEASAMCGYEINNVYVGIGGIHVKGTDSHGTVPIRSGEVTQEDIDRVIESATAIRLPPDREKLHILPREYLIDEQDGYKCPLGVSGVRLESRVYIVTVTSPAAENIRKCCNRAGLNVKEIVLHPLASSLSVLTPDEKKLGVALLDIGGGTTEIAVYHDSELVYTSIIGIGGNHITNDLAHGLRTPFADAEQIKRKYGCALATLAGEDETINVPSVGNRSPRSMPRQVLGQLIEPRAVEIFQFALGEIGKSGYEDLLASGVVITGGTAMMPGMTELAEDTLRMPVRLDGPCGIGGLVNIAKSPIYSTGVGLVLYGYKKMQEEIERQHHVSFYKKVKQHFADIVANLF